MSVVELKIEQETAYAFEAQSEPLPLSPEIDVPKNIDWTCRLTGFWLIVLLPMFFGGVHSKPFYFSLSLIGILAVFFTLRASHLVTHSLTTWGTKSVILALPALAVYFVIQNLVLSFQDSAHPVLGSIGQNVAWTRFFISLSSIIAAGALCAISFAWTSAVPKRKEFVLALGKISVVAVSLVALSHWFYDEGKLFWLFEPDYEAYSTRARWPFVNPNHLAQFIIVPMFICLAGLELAFRKLKSTLLEIRHKSFTDVLQSRRFGRAIFLIGFRAIILFVGALAFLAALSRGSWFGGSIALLVFFLGRLAIDKSLPSTQEQANEKQSASSNHDLHKKNSTHSYGSMLPKRRKSRNHNSRKSDRGYAYYLNIIKTRYPIALKYISKFVFIFAIGFAFFSFLNGKGLELIENRIDYALVYTIDDIRWSMFKTSLGIIENYPIFGIGLSNWEYIFPRYVDTSLYGFYFDYLHSDPLQLVIEGGLFVTLLLLPAITALTIGILRLVRDAEAKLEDRLFGLGLYSGLLGLFVASFFDFPFRIPAITFTAAIYLGLLTNFVRKYFHSSSD